MNVIKGRAARAAQLLFIPLMLGACVSSSPQVQTDAAVRDGVAAVLQSLQRNLPGSYNNHLQTREQNADGQSGTHLRLLIEAQPKRGQFLVTQTAIDGSTPQREYLWQFGASEDGRLLMEFAPRINNTLGRACQLELLPSGNAINGSTQAQACQIPNADGLQLGLQKEYLLAPGRIEIGERLVNLAENLPIKDDVRLRFRRELSYGGWAGRKLDSDAKWQLAQPFQLHNQGDVIKLIDQLERPFGYSLQLTQLRYREDQPEILRLALIDDSSKEQVAFAFADSNASQIGMHLGWLQVGLQLVPATSIQP